jgi:methylated-DNA-[protein]-cysteine S-methyltransferase
LGYVVGVSDGASLTELRVQDEGEEGEFDAVLTETRRQLDAYFAGDLRTFSVPLAPTGTPFQQRVWQQVISVGFGQTASYGELANRLGSVARPVGTANGANPIWIIIPCHRILGANGALTGYAGGLWRKEWLLRHERGEQSLF